MERVSSAPEMDDVISTDQSSRSTKRRAKVWDYVDSELVDGKEKAICKYCKAHLSSVAGKGEPMTGKRMFDSDDEEDDWEI
ncbi:hypothetical protein ZEAMMB73_Zm00001d032348 [Zea mays]|uniref:BED-type domain-containing protein n=1 Tax=Zea mays TaxID=4577 RepID=A0A1D6Q596_MAIZE|nr:hypothetical protein ZEAMMB73_Zm00001d051141 [Zea mays]ONM04907.1 hypothetical protein ZEAMMB73_Zm00001d032348 [Zea mays]